MCCVKKEVIKILLCQSIKFLTFRTVNTIPGLKSSGNKSETHKENQMKWTTEYTVLTSMDETDGTKISWLLVSEHTRLLGLFANHCCRGTFVFVQHEQNPPAVYTAAILSGSYSFWKRSASSGGFNSLNMAQTFGHGDLSLPARTSIDGPGQYFTYKRLDWINQCYGFQIRWDHVPRPITSRGHFLALVRFEPGAHIRKVNLLTTRPYACINTDIHF